MKSPKNKSLLTIIIIVIFVWLVWVIGYLSYNLIKASQGQGRPKKNQNQNLNGPVPLPALPDDSLYKESGKRDYVKPEFPSADVAP